jgi:hypothetical protein
MPTELSMDDEITLTFTRRDWLLFRSAVLEYMGYGVYGQHTAEQLLDLHVRLEAHL